MTQGWSDASTTWNAQPAIDGTVVAEARSAHGTTPTGSCDAGNWVDFSGPTVTAVVNGWIQGTTANYGFAIRAASESNLSYGKRFHSLESTVGPPPRLSITYNTPPEKPTALSMGWCVTQCTSPAVTSASTPAPYATIGDAEDPQLDAEVEYYVGTGTSHGSVPEFTDVVEISSNVREVLETGPANLPDGTHVMRLRGNDGTDVGPWSDWFDFTVDTVAPAVGTLGSSWTRDAWSQALSGSFFWTAGDASVATFEYNFDGTGWSTVPASTLQYSVPNLASGWHTFDLVARDAAGNRVAYPTFEFGIGQGAVTSPTAAGRSSDTFPLAATAPNSGYGYVRFEWARGSASGASFQPIGFGSILNPGTSTPATTTTAGTYSINQALTWKATDQLRSGMLQVRACFATSSTAAPALCSAPNTVQTVPAAFGPTFATDDIGPGTVSLVTGDYTVTATDVAVPTYDGSLTVGRSINTLDPTHSRDQMLTGPQHDVETDLTSFQSQNVTLSGSTTPTPLLGSRSLKLTPSNANSSADTFASLGGDIGGLRLGMTPGHAYTLTGWEYIPASTGLSPDDARGLRLVAYTKTAGSSTWTETRGTAPTSTDAWVPVSVTFRVPATATEAFVRLYNGFAGNETGSVNYFDNLTLTATGIFGPSWTTALPGPEAGAGDLLLEDHSSDGYVDLIDSEGGGYTYDFNASTGRYVGLGDANDGSFLTKVNASTFTSTDADGTVTTWVKSTGGDWQVASINESASNKATSYTWDADGRPVQILGPVPPGVTCSSPLTTVGCRTLTLSYATSTTATSTAPAGWGDYIGQLKQVSFTAADPQNGNAMTTTAVAVYSYDANGRLRAAWDPRLATPLKVTYDYDSNGRLATLTPPGLNAFSFNYDNRGRITTVARPRPGGGADRTSVVYDLPLWGNPALPAMSADDVKTWGQVTDVPTTGTAVFEPNHEPAGTGYSDVTAEDWPYATLHYTDSNGREVNTARYGAGDWQIDTTVFTTDGQVLASLTAGNRDRALHPDRYPALSDAVKAAPDAAARASLLTTWNTYSADGTMLLSTVGPVRSGTLDDHTVRDIRPHVTLQYDEGAPSGGPYRLVTASTESAQTLDGLDHDSVVTRTGYAAIVGGDPTGWQLRLPTSSTTLMGGAAPDIRRITRYDAQGRVIESRMPSDANGGDAGTTLTSYYAAGSTGTCVDSAQAGLACRVAPASQPNSGPALPITTTTYNRWASPVTMTEQAGGSTRTTTTIYDAANRPCSTSTTNTAGLTNVPPSWIGYAPATGLQTTIGTLSAALSSCPSSEPSLTSRITKDYDSDGRVTTYTDADGVTTTTSYTPDGLVASSSDGKGTSTYTYDSSTERRRLLISKADSQAGTFTAAYDASGALVSRGYPNGVTSATTYNEAGQPTRLTYSKPPANDLVQTASYNARGQVTAYGNLLSTQQFDFDNAQRLVQVADHDTQAGTCATRRYGYDLNSNRLSETTFASAADGGCATTTPTSSTTHTYDSADRITDLGYAYDAFGNTTAMKEAELDYGTGTDGDLVVDGADHPSWDPLVIAAPRNYRNVTLRNGAWIKPGPDGILDIKATGTIDVCTNCGVNARALGYPGAAAGTAGHGSDPGDGGGWPGRNSPTFGGGGGGGGNITGGFPGSAASSAPAPAGEGGLGGNGINPSPPDPRRIDDRNVTLTSLLGTGGGAGGNQGALVGTETPAGDIDARLALGGAGGRGGGVIRLSAPKITIAGTLNVSGGEGGAGATTKTGGSGGGGGGSAGAIWLSGDTIAYASPILNGGWGGTGAKSADGGYGADGQARFDAIEATGPQLYRPPVRTAPQLGQFTYYSNNLIRSHTLSGSTNTWTLDPAQRASRLNTTGASGTTTTVNHYSDSSDSPSWSTDDENTGTWTRNVIGIDGSLVALVKSDGSQNLQFTNLHGDVMATMANDASATAISTYSEYLEFGGQRSGTRTKYSWLGGHRRAGEDLGGLVLMGVRLYNPESGRFLQTDPVPGGGANAYSYPTDPINMFDLDGKRWGGWKKWKSRLKRAATVTGYLAAGACIVASAGLCAGATVLAIAASTAYNGGMYRAGEQSGWRSAINIGIDVAPAWARNVRAFKYVPKHGGKAFTRSLAWTARNERRHTAVWGGLNAYYGYRAYRNGW